MDNLQRSPIASLADAAAHGARFPKRTAGAAYLVSLRKHACVVYPPVKPRGIGVDLVIPGKPRLRVATPRGQHLWIHCGSEMSIEDSGAMLFFCKTILEPAIQWWQSSPIESLSLRAKSMVPVDESLTSSRLLPVLLGMAVRSKGGLLNKVSDLRRELNTAKYDTGYWRRGLAAQEVVVANREKALKTITALAKAGSRERLERIVVGGQDLLGRLAYLEKIQGSARYGGSVLAQFGKVKVRARDRYNGLWYSAELGPFRVSIHQDGGQQGAYVIEAAGYGGASYRNGYPHPHVSRDGHVCWGTLEDSVQAALNGGDVFAVLMAFDTLLPTCYSDNAYAQLRTWPNAVEESK